MIIELIDCPKYKAKTMELFIVQKNLSSVLFV